MKKVFCKTTNPTTKTIEWLVSVKSKRSMQENVHCPDWTKFTGSLNENQKMESLLQKKGGREPVKITVIYFNETLIR